MVHSFLLIGQSNMAGRGFSKDVQPIFNEGIKMLCNGRWQLMGEPIHHDRMFSGVGLAASFAAAWRLKHETEEIGLIPCADGGTSLDDWAVGGLLFDHAVAQAKLAQRSSKLAGILWHQGESDSMPGRADVYKEKFTEIIKQLRLQLDVPNIPLIIGGLGDFLTTGLNGKYFSAYPMVNQALIQYAEAQENCYYVTAEGLTANEDQVHFNALSQRVFGIRYFEAFNNLLNVDQPLNHENEVLHAIYERPLTQNEKTTSLEFRFAAGEITLKELQTQMASI